MAKPNQYNQQFEKHHIATLRKWADVRGITQARWRSKALQLMVEEAAVEQGPEISRMVVLVGEIRSAAARRGFTHIAEAPTQELMGLALLHWRHHLWTLAMNPLVDSDESSDS